MARIASALLMMLLGSRLGYGNDDSCPEGSFGTTSEESVTVVVTPELNGFEKRYERSAAEMIAQDPAVRAHLASKGLREATIGRLVPLYDFGGYVTAKTRVEIWRYTRRDGTNVDCASFPCAPIAFVVMIRSRPTATGSRYMVLTRE